MFVLSLSNLHSRAMTRRQSARASWCCSTLLDCRARTSSTLIANPRCLCFITWLNIVFRRVLRADIESCLQGPSQILQVARWFAAASELAVASTGHWAEPRGEAAAAAGPMPVCRFKNKFALARADVPDGWGGGWFERGAEKGVLESRRHNGLGRDAVQET